MGNGFGEAFDGPFRRVVDAEGRHAALAANRCHLLDQAARGFLLAHGLHGFAGDVDEAEVVNFHLFADLVVGEFFEATGEAVAGVVDDDIDAVELFEGCGEGVIDGRFGGHVEGEGEVVFR